MVKIKTQNENTDLQLHHTLMLVAISAFNTRTKWIPTYKTGKQNSSFNVEPRLKDGTISNQKKTVCQAQNMMAKFVKASSLKKGHHNHAEHTNIKQRTLTYS